MLKAIQDSRKQLKALDNLSKETINLEGKFTDELHLFFQYLGRKVLENVDLEQPLNAIFYQQVQGVLDKYWKEYDEILSHYVDMAAIIGNFYYELLLSASRDRAEKFEATKARNNKGQFLDNRLTSSEAQELWAPNPEVAEHLDKYKFEASQHTKDRVNEEINKILGEGYREGWGHRDVASKIQQRFTDLSTYESRRIAQTEINTTRNMVQYSNLQNDGMEYKTWLAAHDKRTRKSHREVDGEIVPINERFSNDLMYPGDKSGDISEWINCRCSHAAYIIPLGYAAPDFFPFKEKDLVKVGSSISQSYVSDIQERLGIVDGVMVRQEQERKIEKPEVVVEPVEIPVETAPEPVENVEAKIARIELQNSFTKDFHTLVSQAEGTRGGVELKPIYNKLKRKYKSKVKNRAEFESLFAKALQSTNTRLFPARDPDLKVIFGKGRDKRGFGYIDRRNIKKPEK